MNRPPLPRLLLLLTLLALAGCQPAPDVSNSRFLAFGTLVDLTLAGASEQEARQATQVLEEDFQKMHHAWHAWDPGPLGRVNRLLREDEPFAAPPSVLPLIVKGKALSLQSDHLFNPAIGHLVDAWGFHGDDPEGHRPPPQERLDALLRSNPRMSDIEIEGITLHGRNPDVKLDFGAFGKGYGIDLAIGRLRQLGLSDAIVNAGGDLRAIGSRDGRPWRIGIRHPDGEGILATVEIQGDESVFTSGDYERNFTWQGRRYHHIIDPRTGYPAEGTRSATVIHSDAVTADAAATALFIAGPGQWHRIARQMGIRYVLLVDSDGNLHMNPAMRERVVLMEKGVNILLSAPLQE